MAKIIGIGGMSRSGKTLLAQKLGTHWGSDRSIVISLDDYAKPQSLIPTIHGVANWEIPESIDYKKLLKATQEAAQRFEWVIVEGLLVFHNEELNALFDYRLILEIDRSTFIDRRSKEARWGAESPAYLQHVWDEYQVQRNSIDLSAIPVYFGDQGWQKTLGIFLQIP